MDRPQETSSRKPLIIISVLLLIIGVVSVGIYLWYSKIYVPAQVKKEVNEYVDATEPLFEKVKKSDQSVPDDAVKIFASSEDDYSDMSFVKNSKKELEEAEAKCDKLSNLTQSSIDGIPESNEETQELDSYLRKYFAKVKISSQNYKNLVTFCKKLIPYSKQILETRVIIDEMYAADTLVELEVIPQKCQDAAEEYTKIKENISKISAKGKIAQKKEIVVTYLEEMVGFFEESATTTDKFLDANRSGSMSSYDETMINYEYARIEVDFKDSEKTYKKDMRAFDSEVVEDYKKLKNEFNQKVLTIEEMFGGLADDN